MLTRLEVDGFKNLVGVAVEFGPFTCIAGPNGVGKSNLFDAIRFLSLLAEHKLMDAARRVRGADDDPTDPRELFTRHPGTGELAPMRLAVEMIVPKDVRDAFGHSAKATITFLRYELELAYAPPTRGERYGRVGIRHESLVHINQSEAAGHLRWPHKAATFRRDVVSGARRGTSGGAPFISTRRSEHGVVSILTHQDGGSRGKPRPAAAADALATVIGATSSVDDPTIFAAKQEMLGWRMLALEPRAMRRPDKYWEGDDAQTVHENGGHVPGTLWHLGAEDGDRARICSHVASVLSDLLPVEEIRVVTNDANQQYELELREPQGPWLGARSLSEGTLRFLALATLAVDPHAARVICMEEPENGIHPSRLGAMLDLLSRVAVDPFEPPGPRNPVRQVIVNTHSPTLVQLLEAGGRSADLLVAEPIRVRCGDAAVASVRFRHRIHTWRSTDADPGVGAGIALAYLTVAPGAQAALLAADA